MGIKSPDTVKENYSQWWFEFSASGKSPFADDIGADFTRLVPDYYMIRLRSDQD